MASRLYQQLSSLVSFNDADSSEDNGDRAINKGNRIGASLRFGMQTTKERAIDYLKEAGQGRSFYDNMTAVVPSKNITETLRVNDAKNIDKDDETLDEIEKQPRRHWVSFIVIYTMIFFNGCCFTAVVPSVPFYLQILNAPPSFLGWVVSFYSVGQLVGSPIAGSLSSKLSSKRLLTLSSTLGVISSLLYAAAPTYWFILLSRFLTGISAGWEFTTELAYIARGTTQEERTAFLATVTAVNVVGFIMGPALTTVLATLDFQIMGISVDKYTGPGWLLVIMFIVDLLMVLVLFKDHPKEENERAISADLDTVDEAEPSEKSGLLRKKKQQPAASYGGASREKQSEEDTTGSTSMDYDSDDEPPPSLTVVATLIFVQFTVMCAWSVLETITSPLAYEQFDWDVQQCNLLFTGGGFVSLIAYFIFVVASKWVQDRCLIGYALVLCFIGLVLMIDWQQIDWVPSSVSAFLSPYMTRFLVGYMVMNAGFMTGRPVTFALYSKLMPPKQQGEYLGWMVAGGSAARTLGPFAAVYLYYGIEGAGNSMLALFGSEAMFQLICLVLVIYLWKQLLPRKKEDISEVRSTRSGITSEGSSRNGIEFEKTNRR